MLNKVAQNAEVDYGDERTKGPTTAPEKSERLVAGRYIIYRPISGGGRLLNNPSEVFRGTAYPINWHTRPQKPGNPRNTPGINEHAGRDWSHAFADKQHDGDIIFYAPYVGGNDVHAVDSSLAAARMALYLLRFPNAPDMIVYVTPHSDGHRLTNAAAQTAINKYISTLSSMRNNNP